MARKTWELATLWSTLPQFRSLKISRSTSFTNFENVNRRIFEDLKLLKVRSGHNGHWIKWEWRNAPISICFEFPDVPTLTSNFEQLSGTMAGIVEHLFQPSSAKEGTKTATKPALQFVTGTDTIFIGGKSFSEEPPFHKVVEFKQVVSVLWDGADKPAKPYNTES